MGLVQESWHISHGHLMVLQPSRYVKKAAVAAGGVVLKPQLPW